MKTIIRYIREYFYDINKVVLLLVSIYTAVFIFCNYYYKIDAAINEANSFGVAFISRYLIFLAAFAIPYMLYQLIEKRNYIHKPAFLILLFMAPAIFALKAALNITINFSDDARQNEYWNHVTYWPLTVIITIILLLIIWKINDADQPFYGIKTSGINWKPYWLMLLIMLPVVAVASTQPDFLAVYPKLKLITGDDEGWITWWHKLLFEISYGSDFIIIELFFRGFLILAFIKWAGKDAILPMACFYCTIHFGKPLGECISSYFGGIVLGIVVYNTRSILGGLLVHLGIAWLMELGGYFGKLLNN